MAQGLLFRLEMKIGSKITVVCCYCKKVIVEKDGEGVNGISHGICETCYAPASEMANEPLIESVEPLFPVPAHLSLS
jgi:hypothetical protein